MAKAKGTRAEFASRVQPKGADRDMPLTVSRPELLVDGSDREFRELVHNLFGFLTRHERIRNGHAEAIGLAGIEYTVLIAIAHLSRGGDVNIKTVAAHLHLSGAFITTTTRRLLALDLIHKSTSQTDRRRVSLTVSRQGFEALARLAPIQRRVNDAEFAGLNREDFLRLNDLLKRLIVCGDHAVALQAYLRAGGLPAANDARHP